MNKESQQPPRWADRFLEWYCRPELLEEIQGDIYELFFVRSEESSQQAARWLFVWDVFRSFRLSTIKGIRINHSTMLLKSNFKIAIRQMAKQKLIAGIKIGGFALGIAVCLLIGLFIRDELSYDTHYQDADQLYRLISQYNEPEGLLKGAHFPAPLAEAVEQDYPEIIKAGRIKGGQSYSAWSNQIRRQGEITNTYEKGFLFADPAILEILEISLTQGDPQTALSIPNSLIISESKAAKFFPNENPIGKSMILNNDEESILTIGGIMEDLPSNSHFKADFMISLAGQEFWRGEQNFWGANNYHTYLKLNLGTDPKGMEEKLLGLIDKYYIPTYQQMGNSDPVSFSRRLSFGLQSVGDIHLHSDDIQDGSTYGDIRTVWLFGAVALVILLLAVINFVNLSIARSANRAKEVGLRKVIGSFKSDLISQFLTESVTFSILSFLTGTVMAILLLPFFNSLAEKSLTFPWMEWWLLPSLLLASILIGLLAGLYPAFYLSSFQPIKVLRGRLSQGSKNLGLQNTLVVIQFTASIVLIVGTFVIYQQMDYILNKKIGFDKEQIVLLQGVETLDEKRAALKQELKKMTDVKEVTVSGFIPVNGMRRNSNGFWKEGRRNADRPVYAQLWDVDHDYVKTLGMNIAQGRDFSIQMPTDSQAIIINQSHGSNFRYRKNQRSTPNQWLCQLGSYRHCRGFSF